MCQGLFYEFFVLLVTLKFFDCSFVCFFIHAFYSDSNYCSWNNVYAENGMPQDLRYICPPYQAGCISYALFGLLDYPSTVHCGTYENNFPNSCEMTQYSNDEWYCSGSCNYPTGYPTVSPSTIPTRSPISPGNPTRAPTLSPSHVSSAYDIRSTKATDTPSSLPTLVPTVSS